MITCKIALPNSPHPMIIGENPGFQALYLARWNEFHFLFNKYIKKIIFSSFLAAGFCLKNLAFARKIVVLPESGLQPSSPLGSYAYGNSCIVPICCHRILMAHWRNRP